MKKSQKGLILMVAVGVVATLAAMYLTHEINLAYSSASFELAATSQSNKPTVGPTPHVPLGASTIITPTTPACSNGTGPLLPKQTYCKPYCVNGVCYKDNGADVFKELFGSKIDAVAPSDPNSYLGSTVSAWYSDDQWMQSCLSLIQKAKELISGVKTNNDKILSIANWVTSSKDYSVSTTQIGGICDLFSAKNGVCLDAANLSTAMYRSVGIPARVVSPETDYSTAAHAYTQVYSSLSGWSAVDTTFGGGQRLIFKPTSFLTSEKYVKFDKPKEIVIGASNGNEFTYYLAEGIFLITHVPGSLSGRITYAKPYYLDPSIGAFIGSASVTANGLQCDYYDCTPKKGVDTQVPLPQQYMDLKVDKMIHVDADGKIAQETNSKSTVNVDLRKDYYVTTTLPPGSYRWEYRADTKLVAYANLVVKSGDNVTLSPSMFIKGDGISNSQFTAFINYLKTISK